MKKITIVGSFSMDLTVTMSEFPQMGQTIIGKKVFKAPGGKGANQCIAAARSGAKCEMIGMLGDDDDGRVIRELFVKEGVDVSHVLTSDSEPTTIALIEVNDQGQNKIIVVPAANFAYTVDDLKKVEDVIADSDIVMAQLEMRLDVVTELAHMCARHGVDFILNPAPAVPLEPELLNKVTYLTPNETELAILTGMKTETIEEVKAACAKLYDLGVKHVIATLGDKGAYLYDETHQELVSGYEVKAVDSVAAGDAFNGAFATALTEGKDVIESIRFACAVGALAVTKPGAVPSLPLRKDTDEFIAQYK